MTPTIISLVSIHRFSIESVLRSFLIEKEQPDLTYKATPPPVEKVPCVTWNLNWNKCYQLQNWTKSQSNRLFTFLGGERHRESKVSCPRTQHNLPGQGSNPDRSIIMIKVIPKDKIFTLIYTGTCVNYNSFKLLPMQIKLKS